MYKRCVSVRAKILKCELMTQDMTHHVVSNDEDARVLNALSVLNVKHMRCIGQNKEDLIKKIRGSTRVLDHALNEI